MTPEDLLPLPPDEMLVWLVALSAFISVIIVWFALIAPRPVRARMRGLHERRATLRREAMTPDAHPLRARGLAVAGNVVRRLRLLQSSQARRIADKLLQAGWRGREAMIIYLFAKVALPLAFGVAAVFFLYVAQIGEIPPMGRLMIALGAVLAGAYAPEVFTANAITKRKAKIQKGMPDGLDLMVICAEAGLSLDATLDRVGRELRGSWPELADELGLTGVELGFLPERRMALENLARRVQLDGIKGLVGTLAQTERYGTPLAQALRVLSAEMRTNRLMKAEEKAARLPAVLTVPMILFILPALFVVLIGPAAINTADALSGLF